MTQHDIIACDSADLSFIDDNSVNLIVTSPPYPMVEMWDALFIEKDESISGSIRDGNGVAAFYKMHHILNNTWRECYRVLADGGFICINVGDATRTIGSKFQLYPNSSLITNEFLNMGCDVLPNILWRKQTNAPNKFMGSGMYPAGAYVTYEHEYILVFRKGGKRIFADRENVLRQQSAYFWEERNSWFSDLWEIKGVSQILHSDKSLRNRSAAFPLDIPLRLVNMYSIKGDIVLDPFVGSGTTSVACMISERNSIGVDVDVGMTEIALSNMGIGVDHMNNIIEGRVRNHIDFINSMPKEKTDKCYLNDNHGFLVKTKQEKNININVITEVKRAGNNYTCQYEKYNC